MSTSDDAVGSPAVPVPTIGVDPRVALATGIQAAPGVYAVLVGSGMSTAAGVPTGWHIAQDLIRKIAVAEGVDLEAPQQTPDTWWASQHRPEPRYDTLLQGLASTDAARQALLREYFDPPPERGGPIVPSQGHHALAALCASGRIRLILTTNFDRLIERALEQAGVTPQVIATAGQVQGMTPLPHAPVTVLKLHGDYTMLSHGLRNTPEELGGYPEELRALLARIFDEFGLLVIGWSAEYDTALLDAMSSCPSRRYPVFWASFNGSLTETARQQIARRKAAVLATTGADELLIDLNQRIARLDQTAVRRSKPVRIEYRHQPDRSPPQGWNVLPLLHLRAVALVAPVFVGQHDDIGPEQREALTASLAIATVTNRLRELTGSQAAYATGDGQSPPTSLGAWVATPGYQSGGEASYSLGTDGSSGISAEATVRMPNHHTGGTALLMIDIGLSLQQSLYLFQVAGILRDGLLATSGPMADAISDILPAEAQVTGIELHIRAAKQDGHQNARANSLEERIRLESLGEPTRPMSEAIGYGAELPGAPVERDAAGLVVDAIKYWATVSGYLDPRAGLTELRAQLGLTTSTQTSDPNR